MAAVTTQDQPFPSNASARRADARSRPLTVALWIVSVATAAMFLMAGGAKLSGDPMMVQMFEVLGGQWFRYLTGGIEVLSAIALLVPPVALYGALALAATMIGAIFTHLVVVGGSAALPVALLVATAFIAWARWTRR